MIFIDSLDQLTDVDTARRNVPFLENVKPHGKTRIIVSMLPDDDETGMNDPLVTNPNPNIKYKETIDDAERPSTIEEPKYWYGPHSKMVNGRVPIIWVPKLSESTSEIGTIIVS